MATLYEIVYEDKQFKEFLSTLEDTEIDEVAIQDTLDSIKAELEVKAEGYVMIMRQLEANQKALESEAKFYQAKADVIKNNVKRLKDTLRDALIETGHDDKTGLTAGNFTLKVQNNGGVQPLTIVGDVPDNMCKVIVEPDNDKIRKYLASDEGKECNWARLEPRGRHLAIK